MKNIQVKKNPAISLYSQKNGRSEKMLEVVAVKERLLDFCHTDQARQSISELQPMVDEIKIKQALYETSMAKDLLIQWGKPPLTDFSQYCTQLEMAEKGMHMTPEQLESARVGLTTVKRLKNYLIKAKSTSNSLAYYEENLDSLEDLHQEIQRVIRSGKVDDFATKNLSYLRSTMQKLEDEAKDKANGLIRKHKEILTEGFYSMRYGKICLPVKKTMKRHIPGTIVDQSASGATVFVEPQVIATIRAQVEQVSMEEEAEVTRILYVLTDALCEKKAVFIENKRMMDKLDFIFAKASMSLDINAIEPRITQERSIRLTKARHPLMDQAKSVPLDFTMDGQTLGIIITGPNTGGKTVAIKTVALLSYMTQCGLHIPCQEAVICLFNQILCDIGDGQNLHENLSTFSAHLTNVLDILKMADEESLVVLDELGSGTDPTEGMGIAIAVLEALRSRKSRYLVTTHYPEVKSYVDQTENVLHARMTFDQVKLCPTYHLEIGKSGDSLALDIARSLGMPEDLLDLARQVAYEKSDVPRKEGIRHIDRSLKESRVKGNIFRPRLKLEAITKQKFLIKDEEGPGRFHLGDSVLVHPDNKIGIVYDQADSKGNVGVQIAKRKERINHKRLILKVSAKEMYPPDYDFSIVFDSVENRKKRHKMEKGHQEDMIIYDETK